LNDLKNEVTSVQASVDKNQALLVALQSRAPASADLRTSNDLLEKYLKNNDRFSNVVAGIVSNSNHSTFNVTKISAESQAQLYGYSQILYSIEADASFISIGKFLESLEDSSLLTEVSSIEIGRTGSELRLLKTKIKLFSYVSKSGDPNIKLNGTSAVRGPANENPVNKLESAIDQHNEVAKKLEPVQNKLMGNEEAVKQ
jgi:Tfp pilus assembly protein PilO